MGFDDMHASPMKQHYFSLKLICMQYNEKQKILKSNRKIAETEKIDTPNTYT